MRSGFISYFSSDDETDDDDEENYERPPRSPLSPRFQYNTVSAPFAFRSDSNYLGSKNSDHTRRETNGIISSSSRVVTRGDDDVSFLKRCLEVSLGRASEMLAETAPAGRRETTSSCWIKHYSSNHRILLVGDGDFSFSTCLARAFGCASNMTATSLDSQRFLLLNYGSALSNLMELKVRNCKVMHEIDATEMAKHSILGTTKFDRIIFNFPFAGFFKDLPRDSQLMRHRGLVSEFMKNAKEMISENGEIHVSHMTTRFFKEWDIETLACGHRLRLIEAVDFSQLDYPGYNTKYGFGNDKNFNCSPSKTYKFGLQKLHNYN